MDVTFVASAYTPQQYPTPDRPEVAFAGRSNVGKSSLLNKLINRRHLAATSSKPGRTRSINFFAIAKDLYFVDLPGYGYAKVPTSIKKSWKRLVESYLLGRPTLRGVVLILDIRRDPGSDDLDLIEWLQHHRIPVLLVLTKADKLSRQRALNRATAIFNALKHTNVPRPVVFSSRTGLGREQLWDAIMKLVGEPAI